MNEADAFIFDLMEHSGIKGMKWGVRRERRNQALVRGGTKGGPVSSRLRSLGRLGPVDIIRGRGIRGGAARKAVRVGGQLDRWKAGEASAVDIVKRFGSTRVTDLIPVRASQAGKKTTHKSDIAVVAAAGAVIAARILAAQVQRQAVRGF